MAGSGLSGYTLIALMAHSMRINHIPILKRGQR
jgi:hypothetical protein